MGFITNPDNSKKQVAEGITFSTKQKLAQMWPLDPMVCSTETVAAGDGDGSPTALSLTKTISFVTTATDSTHVSLGDGTIIGHCKFVVHKTRSNSEDLVITPANLAGGTTLTSDLAARTIMLIWDGSDWQALGEITGTAEFVIA